MYRLLTIYLILINTLSFALMGIDKHRARQGKWRISEKNLFTPVLLGGSIGGLLGMYTFHHKTKHKLFKWGYWGLFFLWSILIISGVLYLK